MVQHLHGGSGVEHQTCLATMVTNELQRAVHMAAGLGVEGDDVGTCLGEQRNERIDGFDHQVHVNPDLDVRADGLAHQRADGEVGHVVVVHHVKVNQICAGLFDGAHLFTQAGKVG